MMYPDIVLSKEVERLKRDNARIRRTLRNHTAKLEEVVAHLAAVETMIDGMRRDIGRERLTFKARPIEGPAEENAEEGDTNGVQ